MPLYEFQCKRGHVTEALVPIGTDSTVCGICLETVPEAELAADADQLPRAERILSPTPTTFVHAGGRKL